MIKVEDVGLESAVELGLAVIPSMARAKIGWSSFIVFWVLVVFNYTWEPQQTNRAGTVNAVFSELVQDKFPFSAKVPERLENERFGTKLKIFRNILSNVL